MSTLPPGAVPPPGSMPPPNPMPPPSGAVPPPGGPTGVPVPPATARRPAAVIAAILLMVPVAVTWLVAGIAFFVAMMRAEGDGVFLVIILAVVVLALCLLLVFMTVLGMVFTWRRLGPEGLRVPASFTFGLFVVFLVGLLATGKLDFQPTMVTPLVVGGLAGAALVLLKSRQAKDWFAGNRR
ncbi:hypothetical protein [Micromonospora sp. NPDC005203]|uniref:hypothetical protein n=1 Tax=Micromonospora sp. NPDC005203 TaxID=3364226 RepID=UPI0036941DEA